jgi:hypothetical protein
MSDDDVVNAIVAYAVAGVTPEETCADLGLVLGFRLWHGRTRLRAIVTGTTWFPRRPVVATCMVGRKHAAPHEQCQCGIYATKSALQLMLVDHDDLWLGPVAMWGTAIEHEKGWRAARAYPLRLERVDQGDTLVYNVATLLSGDDSKRKHPPRAESRPSHRDPDPFGHHLAKQYGVPVLAPEGACT